MSPLAAMRIRTTVSRSIFDILRRALWPWKNYPLLSPLFLSSPFFRRSIIDPFRSNRNVISLHFYDIPFVIYIDIYIYGTDFLHFLSTLLRLITGEHSRIESRTRQIITAHVDASASPPRLAKVCTGKRRGYPWIWWMNNEGRKGGLRAILPVILHSGFARRRRISTTIKYLPRPRI